MVLRRVVKASAVVLGAGLPVTGCSPVKFGAAAITGNQRITIATLTTEVPPGRHHGHPRLGRGGAGGNLRGGEGLGRGPGPVERHPRPHPGCQRDPAEAGRRGRPVPGHPGPVRPAGQRRKAAHHEGGADGYREAPARPVRGCQGPCDKKVNPQFGQLNYTQFQVVFAPCPVSGPSGPPKPAPTAGLTPAC